MLTGARNRDDLSGFLLCLSPVHALIHVLFYLGLIEADLLLMGAVRGAYDRVSAVFRAVREHLHEVVVAAAVDGFPVGKGGRLDAVAFGKGMPGIGQDEIPLRLPAVAALLRLLPVSGRGGLRLLSGLFLFRILSFLRGGFLPIRFFSRGLLSGGIRLLVSIPGF